MPFIHFPRYPPRVYNRVGAPKGSKTHNFYYQFLTAQLKYSYEIYFNWEYYQYLVKRSNNLFYIVIRKNSHSWYIIKNDMKNLLYHIKRFNHSKQIINYLQGEIKT